MSLPNKQSPHWHHRLFPTCDGRAARKLPRNEKMRSIKLAFLEAYFRINREVARLRTLRQAATTAQTKSRERRLLQGIEKAILAREALDQKYAARGVVAVATYREAMTVDVAFNVPRLPDPQWGVVSSSTSVRLSFPLPPRMRRP